MGSRHWKLVAVAEEAHSKLSWNSHMSLVATIQNSNILDSVYLSQSSTNFKSVPLGYLEKQISLISDNSGMHCP